VTKRMSEYSLAIASSTQFIFYIRLLAVERTTSLPHIDRLCSPLLPAKSCVVTVVHNELTSVNTWYGKSLVSL
jgi:hypothetical protein